MTRIIIWGDKKIFNLTPPNVTGPKIFGANDYEMIGWRSVSLTRIWEKKIITIKLPVLGKLRRTFNQLQPLETGVYIYWNAIIFMCSNKQQ